MSRLHDLEKKSIDILKSFEPLDDSYFICYSGGKDSDVIRILAELANVKHELHYNLTTVDAPETVYYIKSIPNIHIDVNYYPDGQRKTMTNLIPNKLTPPTRLKRYCCAELKEGNGKGRLLVTGVRWAESKNREESRDFLQSLNKPKNTMKYLDSLGIGYKVTKKGGIAFDYDNEVLRDDKDILQHCYKTRSVSINPIVDWLDSDVWEFLNYYGCKANPIYQCGFKRVGCVGCPLGGEKSMKREFHLYPKYMNIYIHAFDRMLKKRAEKNKPTVWKSGEEVFNWWIEADTDQLLFDDFSYLDV